MEEKIRDIREDEISKEEIGRAIRSLKDGKTIGTDEIPNKVWKNGGQSTVQKF